MIKLHTEATADWAVRCVKPIEDWLNHRAPLVSRKRFDGERLARYLAEFELMELERFYDQDINALMDDMAPVLHLDELLPTIERRVDDGEFIVSFPSHSRVIDTGGRSIASLSPRAKEYFAGLVGHDARKHAETATAKVLARIQMEQML